MADAPPGSFTIAYNWCATGKRYSCGNLSDFELPGACMRDYSSIRSDGEYTTTIRSLANNGVSQMRSIVSTLVLPPLTASPLIGLRRCKQERVGSQTS